MELFSKKKHYKFEVNLKVEELSCSAFVNAVFYCKLRFVGYGHKYIGQTIGEELQEHKVVWNKDFKFPCKMTAHPQTTELDPALCRLSVRKETKGGKAYQKIGYVDLNLAQYAAGTSITKRFLLEGYNANHRLDNSILKVTISLTLLAGDSNFKAHKGATHELEAAKLNQQPYKLFQTGSRSLLLLDEPYSDPLLKPHQHNNHNNNGILRYPMHFNHNESIESSSKSSSSILIQSRSNSENAINRKCIKRHSGHCFSSMTRPTSHLKENRRVETTRIDADTLVDDIIRQTNFTSQLEEGGLELVVKEEGGAVLKSSSSSTGIDTSLVSNTI